MRMLNKDELIFNDDNIIYSNNNIDTFIGKYKNKKVIIKKLSFNDEDIYDLSNESNILQYLNNESDYIVNYYGCIIENNKVVSIVTEYFKYDTLDKFLEKNNEINIQWINNIILQLCKAINFLHIKGVFHNDIKTDNIIFVDESYTNIKLIDFGSSGDRNTTFFPGTYQAPEMDAKQYRLLYEEYVLDKKIKTLNDFFPPFYDKNDVFQLGFVIWELFHFPKKPFENKFPLECKNRIELITNAIKNYVVEDINEKVPDKYKYIIQSCWKYDMYERITINQIIEILENIYS